MEIKWYDLDEGKPYYEVEIWPYKCDRAFESRYFTTLREARADFRKRSQGYEADCIKHHKGAKFGYACAVVK